MCEKVCWYFKYFNNFVIIFAPFEYNKDWMASFSLLKNSCSLFLYFFTSLLNKLPRVHKCASAQVPECQIPSVSECPSARVPQVLECPSALSTRVPFKFLSVEVPKCPLSTRVSKCLECPSAHQVPECPSALSTGVLLECLSASSARVSKCLECPSAQVPKYPWGALECPWSVLWMPNFL